MNNQTLVKSMYLIAKNFPKFEAHKDDESIMMWYDVFKDEDDLLFQTAVKQLIVTYRYEVPKISNLNDILASLKQVKKIEPGDVFNEITKAIRKYGFYKLEEGYESLSPIAKETVNALGGFRTLCLSETIMVDRSHALKVAETYINRKNQENLLTNSMKKEQIEAQNRIKMLTEGIGD